MLLFSRYNLPRWGWANWALGLLGLLTHAAAAQVPLLRLDLQAGSGSLTDPTYVYAQAGATPEFDAAYDATKLPNTTGLNLASLTPTGQLLGINALPPASFATTLTVPLSVGVPQDGQYTLQVGQLENFGASAIYLTDSQQQTRQLLAAGTIYAFALTGASTASTNRFALVFEPTATPLPVTLVRFTAERQQAAALLRWTTASELRSAYFGVESSADGAAFREVGRLAGAGTSTQARSYEFVDATLGSYASRQVYYRLRQVDTDGTSTFSPVRAVAGLPTGLLVQAYPNPASAQAVTLTISTDHAGPATLWLRNALGQGMSEQHADLPAGSTTVPLAGTGALAPGVYLLRVRQGDQQLIIKVVRQ